MLNGVNYWEERADADGRTELVAPARVELEGSTAVVETRYRYRPETGAAVLEERRGVVFHLPDDDGCYRLDWTHRFTAVEAVEIDRTPVNEETPWGGYAGLSWRAARSLGSFRALNSAGEVDGAVEHRCAAWVDLSGQSDGGTDLAAGIAMFDHRDNPRHPTHWRCILEPGFGFINPAFVLAEPYALPAGESLTLRYRVLVHDGWGDPARLEREFRDWIA